MATFEKEKRYVVLKLSKLTDHQKTALGAVLADINIDQSAMPECVVVEHDWLSYQETWDGIQAIVEGRYVSRDALAAQVEVLKRELCSVADWFSAYWPDLKHEQKVRLQQMDKIAKTTPQQHLVEIRAEAIESAIKTTPTHKMAVDNRLYHSQSALLRYAEQIRKGEVK